MSVCGCEWLSSQKKKKINAHVYLLGVDWVDWVLMSLPNPRSHFEGPGLKISALPNLGGGYPTDLRAALRQVTDPPPAGAGPAGPQASWTG